MISPAGLASPLLLLVGYVGTAVGHRESHSLFLHNKVDLNVLGHKTEAQTVLFSVSVAATHGNSRGSWRSRWRRSRSSLRCSSVCRSSDRSDPHRFHLWTRTDSCSLQGGKERKTTQNMIWYEGERFNVSFCDLTDSWDSREQASGDSMGWSGDL